MLADTLICARMHVIWHSVVVVKLCMLRLDAGCAKAVTVYRLEQSYCMEAQFPMSFIEFNYINDKLMAYAHGDYTCYITVVLI